jgi:hypothetical protein
MLRNRRVIVSIAALAACFPCGAYAADVFTASLDGAQNVPAPIETSARGAVEVRSSADGKKLSYKVTLEKIVNVAAVDLHLGPPTQNGPLVAKLWPTKGGAAKKGDFAGILAEGTLDAGDLIGPLTGAPFDDLLEQLRTGNVYVNVHTNDGTDPPNSGPGDYRLGEIRGQLKR